MGEKSKIEWCDHTFNPWIGCAKVGPECLHCYAETLMDTRYGRVKWGLNGTRSRTSEANWKKPLAWNRAAEAAGKRARVFSASLADVFESRPDLFVWRLAFWELVEATPWLEWLLLTKRPGNVPSMVPLGWIEDGFPSHVRIGTSAGTQKKADIRIPALCAIDAPNFLSVEPLLEEVDLEYPITIWPGGPDFCCGGGVCGCRGLPIDSPLIYGIDQVIVGAESGPGAREMDPAWARRIRDQCKKYHVPFFMKQMSGKAPIPEDLLIREYPTQEPPK